jgi:Tfp pilus assembly protein PilF
MWMSWDPESEPDRVYLAGLLLAVGQVDRAETLLRTIQNLEDGEQVPARLARALRKLIAVVRLEPQPSTSASGPSTPLATEWLAESYRWQSLSELGKAREAARQAVEVSPSFAFAWVRVAELEFSFGRVSAARAALERGLALAPSNAQALALNGYLLAAENRIKEALGYFNQAIALDGALGNAWLGRGLCQIRQGNIRAGRDDLQVAVTMEPQRALLRSYLAKTYSAARDNRRARHEIELAKEKDPRDPTSWLYSALLNQEENRVNEAVDDLETSKTLNENRSVYRSRLLLDQDQAVRGANLASIYRDAGMFDVSVHEAGRAVNDDYANYSAHLLLANSYYEMIDPRQYNLRYETARVSEYLVATLLAPVGAGILSQPVSAQEYARLFERDGLGFYSSTEYLSRGAWKEYAAQYGRMGNFSYSLDGYYNTDPGQRSNNDLDLYQLSFQAKQQVTPRDALYFQGQLSRTESGDLSQVFDPDTDGNRGVDNTETQTPLVLAGYHHEWAPGHHTLFLAGWLEDTLRVHDPNQGTLLLYPGLDTEQIDGVVPYPVGQDYRSEMGIWTAEAQQIFERESYALIVGARGQGGEFQTENTNRLPAVYSAPGVGPVTASMVENTAQDIAPDFQRWNIYGYLHWQLLDSLRLIGGVSYDYLEYPFNFRYAPITDGEEKTDLVSPKAGLIWSPARATTVRAAYSRSLGGVSFDQSFRLEPSQVAGFNQAWRSIIPESVAGTSSAAEFENWNVSLEHRFPTRTYVAVVGEWLESDVDRDLGVFVYSDTTTGPSPFFFQSSTGQRLDYQEPSLKLIVNQLLAKEWALGARYRISQGDLTRVYSDIPATADFMGLSRSDDWKATLQQVQLYAIYNLPCGVFTGIDSLWTHQHNEGYTPSLPSEDFWQFNAFAGYRFPRRQAEVRLALLNFTDQDYRLNPLNLISELPRERTFAASFRLSF